MKDISLEIQRLLNQYGNDTKLALKEHSRLEYLYALSDIRENLLEWYEFEPGASLLQVGSDYGALTGLFARRVKEVVVVDSVKENLETNQLRHKDWNNIQYRQGTIVNRDSQAGQTGICPHSFDYVVIAGTLEAPYEEQIAAAKAMLKPGGRLIVAACNRFGMKYWAGTQRDEHSLSKKELIRLVSGDGPGTYEIYYPMPDYKLPVTIYSQDYLPGKGDLTNTVIAYDYPRYLKLDVGEMYDAVCEDGQFEYFANSFLIIWSSHEEN